MRGPRMSVLNLLYDSYQAVIKEINENVRGVIRDIPEVPPPQVRMTEYMWSQGNWRYEIYAITFGRARLTWGNDISIEAEY